MHKQLDSHVKNFRFKKEYYVLHKNRKENGNESC